MMIKTAKHRSMMIVQLRSLFVDSGCGGDLHHSTMCDVWVIVREELWQHNGMLMHGIYALMRRHAELPSALRMS